jgi:hypothetical protein
MAIWALRNVSGFQCTLDIHVDLNFQVVVACICNSFWGRGLRKPMFNSVREERSGALGLHMDGFGVNQELCYRTVQRLLSF